MIASPSIQPISKSSDDFFEQFLFACQKEFDSETVQKWISKLELVSKSDSEILFSAPSKFIRDWITREFLEKKSANKNLKDIVKSLVPTTKKIAIICSTKEQDFSNNSSPVPTNKPTASDVINLSKHDNIFAFGTELNPRFTFEKFVSGSYNKFALSMARIAAGADNQLNLFDDKIPLFLHGGVGLGKTHLAQAIAWHIKETNKSKKVVYLSAEKFMYHFVQSARNNEVMSFKEKMRSIDVLIVDDIQFIAGKEGTQQEFMNSFNNLVEENKQVVLVCDRCPSDLENIDEKLKSRMSAGMIVNFKTPTYQDRVEILRAKIAAMGEEIQKEVTEEIIDFIARKITTTVRDLEGAIKKLVASKLVLSEEITIENVRKTLSDYVKAGHSSTVTIEKIRKNVAHFYNLKISDLTSKNRARAIARPRQIAMYLAKNLTQESLPKIGLEFGKNHATVIHSVKLVEGLILTNPELASQVRNLEETIKSAK